MKYNLFFETKRLLNYFGLLDDITATGLDGLSIKIVSR